MDEDGSNRDDPENDTLFAHMHVSSRNSSRNSRLSSAKPLHGTPAVHVKEDFDKILAEHQVLLGRRQRAEREVESFDFGSASMKRSANQEHGTATIQLPPAAPTTTTTIPTDTTTTPTDTTTIHKVTTTNPTNTKVTSNNTTNTTDTMTISQLHEANRSPGSVSTSPTTVVAYLEGKTSTTTASQAL